METIISYLAGIIDGEGCIGIECMSPCQKKDGTWIRKHNYYTPRLTVINTSNELMCLLVETFGGSFDQRKQIIGRKTCYRWHIFGENLHKAINKLIPYILIKKSQANVVIKFKETVGKTGSRVTEDILKIRHDLYLQCKEFNKVGS
jgi:hypothetical protein